MYLLPGSNTFSQVTSPFSSPGPDAICCQGDMKFFPQKAEPSPGRPWAKRHQKWLHQVTLTNVLLDVFFLWDLLTYQLFYFFFRKVRVYHAKSIYIFFCQDHLQVQDLDMSTFEPLSVSCLAVGRRCFSEPIVL